MVEVSVKLIKRPLRYPELRELNCGKYFAVPGADELYIKVYRGDDDYWCWGAPLHNGILRAFLCQTRVARYRVAIEGTEI